MASERNSRPHETEHAHAIDPRRRHLLNDLSHLGLPWKWTVNDRGISSITASFAEPGKPEALGLATFWGLDSTAASLGAAEFAVLAANCYQDHVNRIAALEEALRKDRALLETLTAPEQHRAGSNDSD